MIKYPLSFFARSRSKSGIQTPWSFESQTEEIGCAIPPEFEGPGGALSPEDLFLQALTNCFVATFKVYAEKSRLNFSDVQAHSELIVDTNKDKKPVMKKCILRAVVHGCENPDRVKFIAEKAFSSGFILNSVKTELVLDLTVSA